MAYSVSNMPVVFFTVHTVFTGIVLQAVPFMLLGALLSSALYVFVPDRFFVRAFPEKYGLGFLTALFAGLLFPVCECAAVPLMRSLMKKGVAMPIAVTFMLASPIVNPISIISTLYAFPEQPSVALLRLCMGLTIAFGIGLVLLFCPKETCLREDFDATSALSSDAVLDKVFRLTTGKTAQNSREARSLGNFGDSIIGKKLRQLQPKVYTVLMHTCSEFFTAGPFLIIGAFITALMRAAVPHRFFGITSGNAATSLSLMMLFAFVFSACSTSDSFIARSFLNRFSLGSIMGFLVYGPMMDIKNLFMLFALFKKGFVIELTLIITAANFIGIFLLTGFFL